VSSEFIGQKALLGFRIWGQALKSWWREGELSKKNAGKIGSANASVASARENGFQTRVIHGKDDRTTPPDGAMDAGKKGLSMRKCDRGHEHARECKCSTACFRYSYSGVEYR
jgi:hypothetical protein